MTMAVISKTYSCNPKKWAANKCTTPTGIPLNPNLPKLNTDTRSAELIDVELLTEEDEDYTCTKRENTRLDSRV